MFVRLLHPREPEYPVLNPIAAQAGEAVVVGIEEGALMTAVITGYVVPLVLLLLGALIGGPWGDFQSVAGGAAGLAIAVLWLKRRRAVPSPVILRRGAGSCAVH